RTPKPIMRLTPMMHAPVRSTRNPGNRPMASTDGRQETSLRHPLWRWLLSWLVTKLSQEVAGMLVEQQIAERRERAQSAVVRVQARPAGGLYGDYRVQSASGKTYRVAMRGPGLFENYCSCPDFAVNTLGTCKHIEALLLQ